MYQPLSYIHPGAKIAKNVVVEPFSSIDKNVVIGEGTWIGSNVTIMSGARIGKNVSIFPGSVISAVPQDLKFKGEDTTAVIGDNTTLRECVTINRGTSDRNKTKIGKNCLIMAYSHVAHDCFIGDNCIFSNNSTLAGHVTVGNHVILAGMVAVHQFCSIGNHAFVAGGSLVRKDIPPYVKAAREPISYVGINSVGLRRRGFDNKVIMQIQSIYRTLYQKKYNNTQAVSIMEAEMEATKERDEIIQFIKNSQRGIMKGYFQN
ncbi:acyl-ACP--UDP-N-acetylglucosamine O-acyltransferase [Flavobacteriaceae bacterium]|jgi:UDP-N-acetylglucosamine acyltransferase|nr:acyl-ACP--UDP-N-acetylglucosamine O-acyltransferase [Flavobacteriaceae bacterium]|tara:strand:- start:480 stop:1262 length:783 start_codon:yes stop_codon:yes gene_type:complete